jgi:hypothetical protein
MPVFLCAVWSAWLIGNPTTPCCTSRTAPFASPFASRWAMPSFLGSPWRKEPHLSWCGRMEPAHQVARCGVPTRPGWAYVNFHAHSPKCKCSSFIALCSHLKDVLIWEVHGIPCPKSCSMEQGLARYQCLQPLWMVLPDNRGHWVITRNTKSIYWMTCLDSCHSTHKGTDPAHGPWRSHASANRPRLPSHELKCFLAC